MSSSTARDYLIGWPVELPTLRSIVIDVCVKYDVNLADFMSPCRIRSLVWARQEYYFRARTETSHSLMQIARFAGRSDHTTVLHGAREFERRQAGGVHGAA